ncbi:uncharacterized protein METZ01_LOCUS499614, partial [marine metagenome]
VHYPFRLEVFNCASGFWERFPEPHRPGQPWWLQQPLYGLSPNGWISNKPHNNSRRVMKQFSKMMLAAVASV